MKHNGTKRGLHHYGYTCDYSAPAIPKTVTIYKDSLTGTLSFEGVDLIKPGTYTYTVKETAGSTAGVTYDASVLTLELTVFSDDKDQLYVAGYNIKNNEGEKINPDSQALGVFENKYSAGSLAVTKKVTGNLGDRNKYFDVKVTFNAPTGKSVNGEITYTVGTEELTINPTWTDGKAEASITLKHGETVTFKNIPYGVTYKVVESQADGYDNPNYDNQEGKIENALVTSTITNNKGGEVPSNRET